MQVTVHVTVQVTVQVTAGGVCTISTSNTVMHDQRHRLATGITVRGLAGTNACGFGVLIQVGVMAQK